MPEYRIIIVDADGHLYRPITVECADDAEATKQAEQFADDRDVELWRGDRRVVRFERRSTT
jgi:hypothetical protein